MTCWADTHQQVPLLTVLLESGWAYTRALVYAIMLCVLHPNEGRQEGIQRMRDGVRLEKEGEREGEREG